MDPVPDCSQELLGAHRDPGSPPVQRICTIFNNDFIQEKKAPVQKVLTVTSEWESWCRLDVACGLALDCEQGKVIYN